MAAMEGPRTGIRGPEDRNKSSTNVNSWVQIGNRFQEAWAGRLGIDGTPEFHFDVGHAELLEKTQAAVRRGTGVLAREYLMTDVQMGPRCPVAGKP